METIHWRNMITTCNMKMYVHILFCLSFYMKRECIRRSTRKGQIQYKTSGAQKKKSWKWSNNENETRSLNQYNVQPHIIPIDYFSNYTVNSNQSITLFYIT